MKHDEILQELRKDTLSNITGLAKTVQIVVDMFGVELSREPHIEDTYVAFELETGRKRVVVPEGLPSGKWAVEFAKGICKLDELGLLRHKSDEDMDFDEEELEPEEEFENEIQN